MANQHKFFAGMLGIFGHGNVAGIGQALQQNPDFPYIPVRNEQSAVHLATAYAKASNRLRTFACTSSIGPGATNMITGAALATINRLPVLLLPGDIFARRNVAPVLQQLESPNTQDIGVNDCFKPVSRYWDRIYRPEQLITALPEVMRVLTSPCDCGAVTLALPQDVQAEAYDYPEELFRKRVWLIRRGQPDQVSFARAVEAIRASRQPLIVAGGGVLMSEASQALANFASQTGIPVAETQAGKGSLSYDHPQCMGAIGATGTLAANRLAHDADLVIGIGTRYSDFTTASMTAFQNPDVRFVNINTAEFDAYKVSAIPLVADARVALEQLAAALPDYHVDADYAAQAAGLKEQWEAEVDRLFHLNNRRTAGAERSHRRHVGGLRTARRAALGGRQPSGRPAQTLAHAHAQRLSHGIRLLLHGVRNPRRDGRQDGRSDARSLRLRGRRHLPDDADRDRDLGAGRHQDHHRAGGQSRLCQHRRTEPVAGQGGFGTSYRFRSKESGQLDGDSLTVDFVANARSLGAHAMKAATVAEFKEALEKAKTLDRTTVIVVETDPTVGVPGYESWWDVAVAEVSEMETVRAARTRYETARKNERYHL